MEEDQIELEIFKKRVFEISKIKGEIDLKEISKTKLAERKIINKMYFVYNCAPFWGIMEKSKKD